MTYQQIAELIPANYRTEILQTNMIGSAQAVLSNPSMNMLGVIWRNYVNPQETLDCPVCLERVLNNFRQLQPVFIEMEKQNNLLQSI